MGIHLEFEPKILGERREYIQSLKRIYWGRDGNTYRV